jgi:orotidine-5'-phosphate decarboxylase
MHNQTSTKLIVALDVSTAREAREIFTRLRPHAAMFKIGSQLFTAASSTIVREIVAAGGEVFLDLKFHDIPNTVAAAAREATRLGVSIFNLHASGGSEMMRRAADAVTETAARETLNAPSHRRHGADESHAGFFARNRSRTRNHA